MVWAIKEVFDPAWWLIAELSLADGAMRGWDSRNVYYFQILTSLPNIFILT